MREKKLCHGVPTSSHNSPTPTVGGEAITVPHAQVTGATYWSTRRDEHTAFTQQLCPLAFPPSHRCSVEPLVFTPDTDGHVWVYFVPNTTTVGPLGAVLGIEGDYMLELLHTPPRACGYCCMLVLQFICTFWWRICAFFPCHASEQNITCSFVKSRVKVFVFSVSSSFSSVFFLEGATFG